MPDLFSFGQEQPSSSQPKKIDGNDETYKVPTLRAAGRPHDLGWLDILNDELEDVDKFRIDQVPAGNIIS